MRRGDEVSLRHGSSQALYTNQASVPSGEIAIAGKLARSPPSLASSGTEYESPPSVELTT